jgi:hypothetical protein
MVSPISSTLAEMYLQFLEELIIKHWIEIVEISYYKIYVDDILIIFDQNKTIENSITNHINNIHKYLEFKITEKETNISYLNLSIHRHNNNLNLGINRKPTQTDTTIHFTPKHPLEQKLPAYTFYINMMITLPLTENINNKNGTLYLQ